MLHRIQLPDCIAQLEKIREFQRDVLAMACSGQTVLPLTEDTLKNALGDDRGVWLWRKLWRQTREPEESTFHLALIHVIKYANQYPNTKQVILDAYDNDVSFQNSLNDPNFRFKFNTLDKAISDILKPFMISFYKDLLLAGFETAIHGESKKIHRDEFISSFWRANSKLEVCPACDQRRSDVTTDSKHWDDADHYFPKSKYPFLSLHYANLVPTCLQCNRSFKGNRDPIDDQENEPLPNTFHPYEKPALDYIDVLVDSSNVGVHQIKFQDRDGMPSRRVENLKRIFQLHERWPDELRHQIEVLRDVIADKGRDISYKNGEELTEEDLKCQLEIMLEQRREKCGKRVGYVLQSSYLTFALRDRYEFEELFKQFAG